VKEIIIYFKQHQGYARMKELKQSGFHTRKIKKLLLDGIIEKIKPGLYKLSDVESTGYYSQSFIDIQYSMQKAVVCLVSALEYHHLSTVNSSKIYIALPNKEKCSKLTYLPIEVFYFRDRIYNCGIEEVQTDSGNFKIYNAEKTICDMFRYRNKLGVDIALESLKNYLKRKDAKINKLWEYAVECRIKTIMHPYIKAMVAE